MANKTAILSVRVLGDAKKAVAELGTLGDKTSKLGNLASKAGKIAAVGLAAAGAAITAVTVKGVKAAADLEQSSGALDSVFGKAAAAMHGHAKTAATALGLTENSYNELATLLGTQLKNAMGGASADMAAVGAKTSELVGLGADLASMFGGTTADAVGALSSALKGERDPIERYGVSLKQAQIDAKAAEMGFQKVGGSLSNEANAAATLALIMEQTADAHGNFAKESDTFSHQIEVGKAQIGNMVATIGQAFLPMLTQLGQSITGDIFPAAQSLLEHYMPMIQTGISRVGTVISPLIQAASDFVSSGLSPMGIGLQALKDNADPIMGTLTNLGTVLTGTVMPAFLTMAQSILPPIHEAINTIVPPLAEIVGVVVNIAGSLLASLMPPLTEIISGILPPLTQIIAALMPLLADVVTALAPIINGLGVLAGIILNGLAPVITMVANLIATVISTISGILHGFFMLVSGLITGDWRKAWEGAKQIFKSIWDGIAGILKAVWNGIKGLFTSQLENIQTLWTNTWNTVKTFFSNLWDSITWVLQGAWTGITNGVSNGAKTVVSTVKELPSRAVQALGNIGHVLFDAGKNLIQGFINGIKNMFGAVANVARNIGSKAVNGIKGVLGIHSPSKVFTEIGEQTGRGMVLGIEKMQGNVNSALREMVNPKGLKQFEATIKPPQLNAVIGQGPQVQARKSEPRQIVNITINGAIDPDSTARQIRRILSQYDARVKGVQIAA